MKLFGIFQKKKKTAPVIVSETDERAVSVATAEEEEEPYSYELSVLRNSNAVIVDIDRRGSRMERTLTVLFHDEKLGYFCIRQSSCAYAGLGLWYYRLPKDVSDPQIEHYIEDEIHFNCVPNLWFSKAFEQDMNGVRYMSRGETIQQINANALL